MGASIGKTRCAGGNFCALCGARSMDGRGRNPSVERHEISGAFPLGYYEDMQKRTLLYALADEQSGAICGAAVLLAQDERWDGSLQKRAWYVHNLVTAVGASGAGKAILREAEKLAKVRGMEAIRLDCAEGNEPLNAWYESQGYFPCGTSIDGPYHGLLREKLL